MTQSFLPPSTAPLGDQWSLWVRVPKHLSHWNLCTVASLDALEHAAEKATAQMPTAEFVILPPLERPLMPRGLCHRTESTK